MDAKQKTIRVTKPRTITDKYTASHIQQSDWGTFGEFIASRAKGSSRYTAAEKEAKDRRIFGACPGCGQKFNDNDRIHLAASVFKNGKCIGNLLACDTCAEAFNAEEASNA